MTTYYPDLHQRFPHPANFSTSCKLQNKTRAYVIKFFPENLTEQLRRTVDRKKKWQLVAQKQEEVLQTAE